MNLARLMAMAAAAAAAADAGARAARLRAAPSSTFPSARAREGEEKGTPKWRPT